MQAPFVDAAQLVEALLHLAKPRDRIAARVPARREYPCLADARQRLDRFEGKVIQWRLLWAAALGALAAQHQDAALQVNLGPAQLGNLVTPQRGADQQPDEWRPGPAEPVAGVPDSRNLAIGQHALAGALAARLADGGRRIGLDQAALLRPCEQTADHDQDLVCRALAAGIHLGIQDRQHVMASDAGDFATMPAGDQLVSDHLLRVAGSLVPDLHMPLDVLFGDGLERVELGLGRAFCARVLALCHLQQSGLGELSGIAEPDCGPGAELQAALLAGDAVKQVPRLGALANAKI